MVDRGTRPALGKLFEPGKIGKLELKNRIVMAPMTRSRASATGVPSDLAQTYYAQRADAGLRGGHPERGRHH